MCKDSKTSFHISRGRFKGMKLSLESNFTTRPTKSLVKKSFLDSIQNRLNVENLIFIECFAGSGQIGFEMLSLGVEKVIFFELDSKSYHNLRENISVFITKSKLDSKKIQSYNIDFFKSLSILESLIESNLKNDIIQNSNDFKGKEMLSHIILYLDPPFSLRAGFSDIYIKIQNFIESFSKSLCKKIDIIVIEALSGINIASSINMFEISKESKFGKTSLMYYNRV